MNGYDLFKMAIGNLLRRKSRTLLTILGIVIGTVSIVLMIGLGLGMQASVSEQFENVASANIITVTKGDNVSTTTRLSESEENDNLQGLDIDFLKGVAGVKGVSPVLTTTIAIASSKYEATMQLVGLDTSLMAEMGYEVYEGRLPETTDGTNIFFGLTALEGFDEVEESNVQTSSSNTRNNPNQRSGPGSGFGGGGGAPTFGEVEEEETVLNVDVFNDRVTMSLDASYSPQSGNTSIDADIYRIKGVGILEEGTRTRDSSAYMDVTLLEALIEDYDDARGSDTDDGYGSAYVIVEDVENVDAVVAYIEAYDYSTSTSSDFLETIQGTTETLTIALGAIGAVSLFVAAIGITNTMNMAIHERKKEIGVMKVIGATIKDIKRLFLTESAIIGFLGGVVGVGFSLAASEVLSSGAFSNVATGQNVRNPLSTFTSFNVVMPTWLIVVGLVFTTLIGVISGYIPARNAMKASALEAIKTE